MTTGDIPGLFHVHVYCPAHPDQLQPCAVCVTRRSDPQTSLTAARRVRSSRIMVRTRVLGVFDAWGILTDKQLIARYRESHGKDVPESTIRTRRNELSTDGHLVKVDEVDGQTRWVLKGRSL